MTGSSSTPHIKIVTTASQLSQGSVERERDDLPKMTPKNQSKLNESSSHNSNPFIEKDKATINSSISSRKTPNQQKTPSTYYNTKKTNNFQKVP